MSKEKPCCDGWRRALENGTDSEGCYPAITYRQGEFDWPDGATEPVTIPDGYCLGVDLPLVLFCPWCGERVPDAGD